MCASLDLVATFPPAFDLPAIALLIVTDDRDVLVGISCLRLLPCPRTLVSMGGVNYALTIHTVILLWSPSPLDNIEGPVVPSGELGAARAHTDRMGTEWETYSI